MPGFRFLVEPQTFQSSTEHEDSGMVCGARTSGHWHTLAGSSICGTGPEAELGFSGCQGSEVFEGWQGLLHLESEETDEGLSGLICCQPWHSQPAAVWKRQHHTNHVHMRRQQVFLLASALEVAPPSDRSIETVAKSATTLASNIFSACDKREVERLNYVDEIGYLQGRPWKSKSSNW